MWSVFFVFLSYLDRNFVRGDQKASKDVSALFNGGTLCAKMSNMRESFLYQVSDGAQVVRSVVGPAGNLVNCSVVVNQTLVKAFVHECRLEEKKRGGGGGGGEGGGGGGRMEETRFTRMEEAEAACREFMAEESETVLKRSKRGFTYPGTLWCGAGNMADNYDQLGEFAETDSCCRVHDHCPHVIHAFSSNYGHTNFKWHSICHCDCDEALKSCLRKVNDTSSRVVGQAFFNVIGVPCFQFAYEEQCAERHWYGVCKRYEKFPVAVLKEAVPYDFGGIAVIDKLPLAPPKREGEESTRSEEEEEEEKPESATQSTMSGPDEPSLGNVVTAAEDFIKVLATVSTSQSSAAGDSDKGETQGGSEKKKRKKEKKKTKKPKGKGKGRKRKQKAEEAAAAVAAASPSGGKAEDVVALSNFISETHERQQANGDYKPGEPLNEVMKDEPAADRDAVSTTTPETPQKKVKEESEARRPRKGRRRKMEKTSAKISPVTPTALVAITPAKSPKVKRTRSKERGDGERRKKRRRLSSPSDLAEAAAATPENEHETDAGTTTAPNFSALKRQRLKGSRSRRRKTVFPPLHAESPTTSNAPSTGSDVRLLTTAAPIRRGKTIRRQRKARNKTAAAASVSDGVSIRPTPEQNLTFTSTLPRDATTEERRKTASATSVTSTTTAAAPAMSPAQLSIKKANAQFSRKKKRKAALAVRQQ